MPWRTRDQPAFSPPKPISKPAFVSSNVLFIALVFLIGHVGLVKATAIFDGAAYSVEFAVHIGAIGVRRTRRASESGTFSVDGNRILLNAVEASADGYLGDEVLSEIRIDGNVMNLVSNNGNNREVWAKASR